MVSSNQEARHKLNRRSFVASSIGLAGLTPSSLTAPVKGISIDLKDDKNFKAYLRLLGSLAPATTYTCFNGEMWGIKPNDAPRPLVSFQGLAKNVWTRDDAGMVQHSFDIGFFGDLETGDVLDTFLNPYTNKEVAPYHFMYGGGKKLYTKGMVISGGEEKSIDPKWMKMGGQVWIEDSASASVGHPFDPEDWPQASSGDQFHFGSATTYIAAEEQLFDLSRTQCPYSLFWTAIHSWDPWLLMGQQPGFIMWRGVGRKVINVGEIPKSLKDYISKKCPDYFAKDIPWEGQRSTYKSYKSERSPKKG